MLKYGVSDIRDFYKSNQIFVTILMKILFSHLKKFLPDDININTSQTPI